MTLNVQHGWMLAVGRYFDQPEAGKSLLTYVFQNTLVGSYNYLTLL